MTDDAECLELGVSTDDLDESIALVAFGKEHEVELDVSNIGFIN